MQTSSESRKLSAINLAGGMGLVFLSSVAVAKFMEMPAPTSWRMGLPLIQQAARWRGFFKAYARQ